MKLENSTKYNTVHTVTTTHLDSHQNTKKPETTHPRIKSPITRLLASATVRQLVKWYRATTGCDPTLFIINGPGDLPTHNECSFHKRLHCRFSHCYCSSLVKVVVPSGYKWCCLFAEVKTRHQIFEGGFFVERDKKFDKL